MHITDWLVALIPILSFGILPVIATKIGGKPVQQSMGVALGSLIFAIVVFFVIRPELNAHIFIISLLSGVFWSVGSVGQFVGIRYLGVAKATPILNGSQIIGTSIVGMLLGEWATTYSRIFGISALILIIIGIVFTSYKEKQSGPQPEWKKGILINVISALGFTFYVGILKYFNINGWSSILPQSFGQIAGIIIIALVFFKTHPFGKLTYRNSIAGIVWAIGNIALLISQVKIGLAVAYPVSMAAVIISVLGGVLINKEHKTRKEWISAIAGMLIIVTGLYFIYLSSMYDIKPL